MWQVTMKYNHAYLVYRLTIIASFNVCGGGYSVQFLLGWVQCPAGINNWIEHC